MSPDTLRRRSAIYEHDICTECKDALSSPEALQDLFRSGLRFTKVPQNPMQLHHATYANSIKHKTSFGRSLLARDSLALRPSTKVLILRIPRTSTRQLSSLRPLCQPVDGRTASLDESLRALK